ncbi:ABC transporter substrate-binding protein [Ruminococcus flavefaciens]|uniref:ABC transporter substrate-binding protein n=1 Tax=Ruminococcus flavefaciens TaxID=1265 RepID=UPI00048DA8E3|nr:extracellular solute-binding protein [Ruminococcus flavefaciens]
MEKSFSKRITALTAALAVIAGSAASCGKKEDSSKGEKKTAQELMAASYRAVSIDTDVELNDVSDMKKLDDGRIFISAASYGSSSPSFYIADSAMTSFDEIKVDLGIKEDEEVNLNSVYTPDGDIMVMATFSDYGDQEKPDFEDPDFDYQSFDFEEFYKNVKQTYKIYTVDLDGKVTSENEIKGLDKYEDDESRLNIGNFYPCGGGKAILSVYGTSSDQYVVINADGTLGDEVKVNDMNWINNMSAMGDGTLAVIGYASDGEAIKFLDMETLSETGDSLKLDDVGNTGINSLFPGNDDYKFFASTGKGIVGIDKDGKSTELINWVDSDMGEGYVNSFIPVENGEFIIWYSDYSNESESGLYRLTKRDASELENTKIITIGVLYDDWQIKGKVSSFNKSHDGVRFKIEDYSKYDDYDSDAEKYNNTGEGQLKKDIVSGKAPDMIVANNRGIIDSLYKKGLFEDLYNMLDKDPDISKEDIMPNVLAACEAGGKLYSITPSFYIETLAAKKSNCDKENWTVDEMIDAYNNLPDGMRFTSLDCKESMLMMVLSALGDVIDYEKGTCNFDTPDFRKLIAFIDQFPSQDDVIDWEDETAMQDFFGGNNIKENKVLLQDMYINNFTDYTEQLKGEFEGDISFVGFPSSTGKGSVLGFSQSFAILSNSENKDECWELIKSCFNDSVDEENGVAIYGFPSLKSAFDKMAEKSLKKPTYKDENGKEVEQDLTYHGADGKEVKIDPLTVEEKDFIVDYIKNTTQVSESIDPDVGMILEEELMAYLKGEKKADEVIELLQSRISLLVSEQS